MTHQRLVNPPKPRDVSAAQSAANLRFGLCCQFKHTSISFRTTTATYLLRLSRTDRLRKLSDLCRQNAESLMAALRFCKEHRIGAFRIASTILPIKTHAQAGYQVDELPDAASIIELFCHCGQFARDNNIRTLFHPDQFVVLNSPRPDVVTKAIQDLEYHAEVAGWVEADVINIHGGGAYGDKAAALERFCRTVDQLSDAVRCRLTVENDDKVYAPHDLLPVCQSAGLPLVYDVHHHRCLPDGLSVEDVTARAIATWNREPLFHISSPLAGWSGPKPERHHDLIDVDDFPAAWAGLSATVEVEAKAKEVAVLRLRDALRLRFGTVGHSGPTPRLPH